MAMMPADMMKETNGNNASENGKSQQCLCKWFCGTAAKQGPLPLSSQSPQQV
jgi:hypothetical protein